VSSNTPVTGSGDGTRPTTSGGVDNIGGGEKFSDTRSEAGENVGGPAPQERMQAKRKNAEASTHDDSDAFGLHEDLTPASNREPAPGSAPALEAESETRSDTAADAVDETNNRAGNREEAIRHSAYAAYERRGCVGGHEVTDWLEAEAEVDARNAPKI
jgi:hypothetical protein